MAAKELAKKEHITLEMVRGFMGKDYSLMKKRFYTKRQRNL